MKMFVEFSKKHDLHIICDEIYALSTFPGAKHISMAKFYNDYEKIHIVGGLSKDFGMSGFRVGYCHSMCPEVIKGLGCLGYFQAVSNLT